MSEKFNQQPPPKPGGAVVATKVITDIAGRINLGMSRYGTPLMTHNGRDAHRDAYEEALDLAICLKQDEMEREYLRAENEKLRCTLSKIIVAYEVGLGGMTNPLQEVIMDAAEAMRKPELP
jgi:hypothetical protein